MKIFNKIIKTTLLIFLTSLLLIPNSFAESLQCPQTDHKLQPNMFEYDGQITEGYGVVDGRVGIAACRYENNIILTAQWSLESDLNICTTYPYSGYLSGSLDLISVLKKAREFTVNSPSHTASVTVKLNKKEFKQKRRSYWVNKAQELLSQAEQRTLDCTHPAQDQGKPKEKHTLKPIQIIEKDGPKKQATTPSNVEDTWDSPSPKAKILD